MQEERKARMVGINHVAIEVDDVDAALEFYGRIFEIRLRGRHDRMVFIDMGDQFINLSEKRSQPADRLRHFGLVVDDRETVRAAVTRLGAEILPSQGLDFLDPWGNHIQVVQYSDIQFTKTPQVLRGMGLGNLEKTDAALHELREKGLA